jgi:hypothetical protein
MAIYDQKCKLSKRTNRQISLALLVHKRANWRAEEESGQNPSNIEQQLIQAICRGEQRINDTENTYNLITTRIDEMSHFPDWLPHVRWSSVFDFDPSAQLYRACKDGFIIPPKLLAIDDVRPDRTNLEFRQMNKFGRNTLWLSANPEGIPTSQEWLAKCKEDVGRVLAAYTEDEAPYSRRKLVFIIIVDAIDSIDHIMFLLQDIVSKKIESNEIAILTVKDSVHEALQSRLGEIFPNEEGLPGTTSKCSCKRELTSTYQQGAQYHAFMVRVAFLSRVPT